MGIHSKITLARYAQWLGYNVSSRGQFRPASDSVYVSSAGNVFVEVIDHCNGTFTVVTSGPEEDPELLRVDSELAAAAVRSQTSTDTI
jgi:hypothetical protein